MASHPKGGRVTPRNADSVINQRHSTLENGLQLVTASMPSAYSTTVQIFVGVGSRYEQAKVNGGVSHFLEHLLFKGTEKRPSTKIISEQVDAVGGYTNAYTNNEFTSYFIKVPYQHTKLALDILADMMRNSTLDPEEIDRERDVVLEEMNVYHDDPSGYVYRLTPPLLWPGHPLAADVIGNPRVIRSIKRDAIADYWKSHYHPGNMVVVVAGRVDHDRMLAQVGELMGDMKKSRRTKAEPVRGVLGKARYAALEKDTAQSHLLISSIAYPYHHKNDPAAKLLTTVLGRGLSSRLFLNVREQKGLAYSVSAHVENFVDTGEFTVHAGVNIDKQADAIGAILEELQIISTELVSEEELTKAKNQIRGGLQMASESNSSVADRIGTQQLLLGKTRSVEETLAEIEAVTPADIRRTGAKMLDPKGLRMGIISPEPAAAIKAFEQAE